MPISGRFITGAQAYPLQGSFRALALCSNYKDNSLGDQENYKLKMTQPRPYPRSDQTYLRWTVV